MTVHKILIADDEPNIVLSLEFLLKREGFAVQVATDGQAVLDSVEASPPDLVLLDVMMPLKNGFEVCQALKARPEWAHIPVVMLTAKSLDTDVAKGLALGAAAYITKPFSTRELVDKVRALLGAAP